jgi:outer membrane lipase/esterase
MKTRRWTRVALAATLFAAVAAAGYGQPYTDVYVFGNSHVDVGNVHAVTQGVRPPSPPYFQGRFSNGPAFPEVAADNLDIGPLAPSVAGGTGHAWGGAQSLVDLLSPSVRSQVLGYLGTVGGDADPEALYVLEGGGNDVSQALWNLAGVGDWDGAQAFVEEAALGMVGSLQMLADAGADRFVVVNAAYISESAWFCGDVEADALVARFNTTLEEGLSALNGDLRVAYFDLATFGRSVSEHFITGCEYCVPFLEAEPVCSDPDLLFYWDEVHFSAPVHQLIGDAVTVSILQDEVRHLRATRILSRVRARALLILLKGAYRALGEREVRTAVWKMRIFAYLVKAFVRKGRLTPEQAELLLVGAQGIIDQPGDPGCRGRAQN